MSTEHEDNMNLEQDQEDLTTDSLEQEAPHGEIEQETPDIAAEAKATGHLSKEEWVAKGGDPAKYKTEKEFVLTGELIELKKALHKRDSDIEELVKYHRNVVESQKQSFRQQLEARLNLAKEEGDINQVENLSRQKYQLDQQEQLERAKQEQQAIQQAAQWFVARNQTWFNDTCPDLKARTAEVEQELRDYGDYSSYTQLARALEDRMRAEIATKPEYAQYVHLLSTHSAPRPAVSASRSGANSSARAGSSEDGLVNKLSRAQQLEYKTLAKMHERTGIKYSVKDYIEQTKDDGEV